MDKEVMKPCPFCGSKVKLTRYVSPVKMFYCTNEDCEAIVSFNNDQCNYETGTTQKLLCWNRRVKNDQ